MAAFSGNYCARFQELLPLHALGTPLGEEGAELREHLESCAACRRELEEHLMALSLLPLALDPVRPSPGVQERLMEEVRRGGPPTGLLPVPVVPLDPGRKRQAVTHARGGRLRTVLLAASLAVAAGAGLLLLRERQGRLQAVERVALLQAQLRDAREAVRSHEERLRDAEQKLAFLQARTVQLVNLKATAAGAEAAGRILWDQERRAWLFFAFHLPPPPPDKDYQLWFLVKGDGAPQPVSAGLATPLPTGDLEAQVSLPQGLPEVAGAAVTLEPKGGVEKPTSQPVLVGTI